MNIRLLAVLLTALFAIGIFPVLFVQSFGSASAGVTAGFLLSAEDIYHVSVIIAIGVFSAWIDEDALLLLPLSTLLMLVLGSLISIHETMHHGLQVFILGAIILFSANLCLTRNKSLVVYSVPASVWAYFSGSAFMHASPSMSTPLFFMIGNIVCTALFLAIGIALGITLYDTMRDSMEKLKNVPALMSFLSLF